MLALAIAGLMSVPLTGVVATQLSTPLRIADLISTSSKLQASTIVLLNDAVSAQSFTPGEDPEYGTFRWLEFSGSIPVAVSAQYFWQEESVFRLLSRGAFSSPPFLVIGEIEKYSDVVFRHTPSVWVFDENTQKFVYTRGRIAVDLDIRRESSTGVEEILKRGFVVADFRPSFERPAPFPSPLR